MNLIFQVAVGERRPLYERCIRSVAEYCDKFGIEHRVLREPVLKIRPTNSHRSSEAVERLGYLPIYEKENAFAYLGEYDQVAIVDADVYIRPSAPDIFEEFEDGQELEDDTLGGREERFAFAGVIEQQAPITEKYARKLRHYTRGQYGPLKGETWFIDRQSTGIDFYNMGVMVITKALIPYLRGQTPGEFLRRPEFARFVNGEGQWKWSTDQTLLNYWIRKEDVPDLNLDWKWNAMWGAIDPQAMWQAHFVHFFLSDKLPKQGAEIEELIGEIEG